jgi:HK97 family phage major capsid protein
MGEVIVNHETDLLAKLGEIAVTIEEKMAKGDKSQIKVNDEVKSLGEALELVTKKIGEMEVAMTKRKGYDLPGLEDEKEKFSLFKACSAIATKNFEHASFEKSIMDECAKKTAQSAGVDTLGGYIVPMQALGGIIELLRSNMVLDALGATTLSDLVGVPVEVPKQTGSTTAHWVEENAALTESNITLGQLAMNPKGLGALVKMSNRSLRLSNPSLENLVRNDITEQIARALDLAGIFGTGTLGQPLGVANQGIATVDMTLAVTGPTNPSWEGLYELEGLLEDANALKGKLGYAMSPGSKRNMSKLRHGVAAVGDQGGAFMHTNPMTAPMITAMLGHPFQTSTSIPNTSGETNQVFFGNWADLLIGMWGGLQLKASEEAGTSFVTNQTWVRAIMDVDIAIRRVESFCVAENFSNDLIVTN